MNRNPLYSVRLSTRGVAGPVKCVYIPSWKEWKGTYKTGKFRYAIYTNGVGVQKSTPAGRVFSFETKHEASVFANGAKKMHKVVQSALRPKNG